MHPDFEQLFQPASNLSLPAGLAQTIWAKIQRRQQQRLRARLTLLSASILGSGLTILATARYAVSEIYQSGFLQYASVLFTDSHIALQHWQEFALSLLESLPVVGAALLLGTILVFLISLRSTITYLQLLRRRPLYT